jgi:hypothetical protein
MFRMRYWAQSECINGILDQDLKEQLHLRKEKTFGRISGKIVELEIAKQTVETSIRLSKMNDWTLWRGHPPSKTKEKTAHRVGAIHVGALTTLRTFGRTSWRKLMVINLDQLAPYMGTTQDKQP